MRGKWQVLPFMNNDVKVRTVKALTSARVEKGTAYASGRSDGQSG